MPGWHAASQPFQERGDLQVIGIIQEQHPDRCRLFMQWKEMDWPILVDSYNELGISVVPVTLLVDEFGVVRSRVSGRAEPEDVIRDFLKQPFQPPVRENPPESSAPESLKLMRSLAATSEAGLKDLIDTMKVSLREDPSRSALEFSLGVAYRKIYDSPLGESADFHRAVTHWTRALELDPNNYIWRRRLQQFGPRLEKPYPFYDWVDTARREITQRGEQPLQLSVEPKGAELAVPLESFRADTRQVGAPDPEGRIYRDEEGMVQVQVVSIPETIRPGGVTRVHVEFRPNRSIDAHWNNEAEGLSVWVDPPAGWAVDRRLWRVAQPPQAVSEEARTIEFELQAPTVPGRVNIPAYALYYVCEGVQGTCLYRRQDFSVPVVLEEEDSP